MPVVPKNNARTVTRQDLSAVASTIVVVDGTVFPELGAGEYFYLTLMRSDTAMEIVKVLAVAGNSLTVTRAQEGTSAREFPAGSFAEARVTVASVLDAVTDVVNALTLGDLGITATASEINVLDGVTASTAEINLLDGVTATTAELNILDGVTATAAEINILDGALLSTAELNILDGVTATTAEINILDGVTATAAEINILDGVTASTAEINILDGVTVSTADINGVTAKVPRTSTTGSAVMPSGTSGQRDVTALQGYLRFNNELGVFEGYYGTVWGSLGGATGGGSDRVFYENGQTVTTPYDIPSGRNAMSAGPITINAGATVTIPSGSVWTIV